MNLDQQNEIIENTVKLSAVIINEALLEANVPDSLIKKVLDKLKGYNFKKQEIVFNSTKSPIQLKQAIGGQTRDNSKAIYHDITDEKLAWKLLKETPIAFNTKTKQFGMIIWSTPEGLHMILNSGAWANNEVWILCVAEYERLRQFDDTNNSSWSSPSVACMKTVFPNVEWNSK